MKCHVSSQFLLAGATCTSSSARARTASSFSLKATRTS